MVVDISDILKNKIDINSSVTIPKDLYKDTEIIDLLDVKFNGSLEYNENDYILKGLLTGIMILKDSISLENINYNFSIEINDILEKSQEKSLNTLEITSDLWQNIYLEIPLKFTNVCDFSEYHGDGWKLVSETDTNERYNNPFKDLENLIRKE